MSSSLWSGTSESLVQAVQVCTSSLFTCPPLSLVYVTCIVTGTSLATCAKCIQYLYNGTCRQLLCVSASVEEHFEAAAPGDILFVRTLYKLSHLRVVLQYACNTCITLFLPSLRIRIRIRWYTCIAHYTKRSSLMR